MLFLVDDEHAVGALGSAQLTRIGDADGLRNGECGQRTQRRDGAGGGDGRTRRALGAARGDGRSGLARLALQFALDLLANAWRTRKREKASVSAVCLVEWKQRQIHTSSRLDCLLRVSVASRKLEVELMLEVEAERGRSWRVARG